jgi:hypothetical protein
LKAALAETNRQHHDRVERLESRIQALVRWGLKKICNFRVLHSI